MNRLRLVCVAIILLIFTPTVMAVEVDSTSKLHGLMTDTTNLSDTTCATQAATEVSIAINIEAMTEAITSPTSRPKIKSTFRGQQLIAPSVLIGLGVVGYATGGFGGLDRMVRDKVVSWNVRKTRVDDYLQFAPIVVAYGLDLCGVRARHSFKDRTMILATAAMFTAAMSLGGKYAVGRLRPDGSAHNSFPSGHTAVAFMGAEYMRQEYAHLSPWYGIGAYAAATAVGVLRVYNNRHWVTDVLVGAGVGILGTRIAYWLYPYLNQWLFGGRTTCRKAAATSSISSAMALPYYDGQTAGLCMSLSF